METQPLPQQNSEPLPPLTLNRIVEFYDGSDANEDSSYTLKTGSGIRLAELYVSYFAGCCGAAEFFGLRDFSDDEVRKEHLAFLMRHALDLIAKSRAYVTYTTIEDQKDVIAVLKATGFKRVGKPTLNPNSGNKVTMWVKSLH